MVSLREKLFGRTIEGEVEKTEQRHLVGAGTKGFIGKWEYTTVLDIKDREGNLHKIEVPEQDFSDIGNRVRVRTYGITAMYGENKPIVPFAPFGEQSYDIYHRVKSYEVIPN